MESPKWKLMGITETNYSNSEYSKNKNRFIYHIKNVNFKNFKLKKYLHLYLVGR